MLIWCCQNFHLICSAQQQTHLSHEEGKVEWVTEQSHLRCGNRSRKAFQKKKNQNIVRSSSQTESSWFLLCMSSKYLLSRQMDCGDRTLWHRGRHKQFPKQRRLKSLLLEILWNDTLQLFLTHLASLTLDPKLTEEVAYLQSYFYKIESKQHPCF